jgi:hypothetical protein
MASVLALPRGPPNRSSAVSQIVGHDDPRDNSHHALATLVHPGFVPCSPVVRLLLGGCTIHGGANRRGQSFWSRFPHSHEFRQRQPVPWMRTIALSHAALRTSEKHQCVIG